MLSLDFTQSLNMSWCGAEDSHHLYTDYFRFT
jgi:hypothetical protein